MKIRIWLLIFLIFIRIIIGFCFLLKYRGSGRILVTGKVVKVEQLNNKCIIDIGMFVAKGELFCKLKRDDLVKLIGSPKVVLIEGVRGKIVIDNAVFADVINNDLESIRRTEKTNVFSLARNYSRQVYQSFLPRDESALLAGIVLGDKENIGYYFYQKMLKSGTIHIAVASGYNLMLVGGTVISLLFWFFKRRWASTITIVTMSLYAILAGFEPPVVRALFMASLIYICAVVGRKADATWFLFLSAWPMLVWDPGMLWSVSFQLSIAASMGLMVLAPWVQEWFTRKNLEKEGKALEKFGLITTVCTMLVTTPIIWWHFGRISIIGLFSNIFILPLVPPVMILGVFTLLVPGLFFVPTYALVHLMVLIINFFGV